MRAADHTGKKYGRLVAIAYTGKSGPRGRIWRFLCDCGREAEISASLAKTGHTSSCGCLLNEARHSRSVDRTGERNGRLTFTRFIGRDKNQNAVWEAICDCGQKVETATPYKSTSCGCLRMEKLQSKAKDLAGSRQGRIVFTRRLGHNRHGRIVWEAICDCGKKARVVNTATQKSCGCLRGEARARQMQELAMPHEEKDAARKSAYKKYRAKKKEDPIYLMRMRITHLHRKAIKQVGGIKRSSTLEALGYSAEELKLHMERQFTRGMGWRNQDDWHIDHIIPMSTAKTVADVIALNQLSNLRPMWASDNIRKGNKRYHLI